MKKILVTDKKVNKTISNKFEIVKSRNLLGAFKYYLDNYDFEINHINFDIETNGLDFHYNKPLLYGFNFEDVSIVVVHNGCKKQHLIDLFKYLYKRNITLVGHNIKFDIGMVYTNELFLYDKIYCTMVANQRCFQKTGISNSLKALIFQYCNIEISKDIRNTFIGRDYSTYNPTINELDYLLDDIGYLTDIRLKQKQLIIEKEIQNLIYHVEFPLISIVAKAEIKSFPEFDIESWKKLAIENLEKSIQIANEMDNILSKVRDNKYNNNEISKEQYLRLNLKLKGNRKKSKLLDYFTYSGNPKQKDLFGNTMSKKSFTGVKKKVDFKDKHNINYGSYQDILLLFGSLNEPLPTSQGTYVVPEFDYKGKIDNRVYSFKTGVDYIERFITDEPTQTEGIKDFALKLLEYRKYMTRVNTFGETFEDYINPVSNTIHTVFRTCHADTGRFQSGDKKSQTDKVNFQNIPGDNSFRNCFKTKKGRKLITMDYAGAELIVICALSGDTNLYNLSKGDMHSAIATKCYRRVYAKRRDDFIKFLNNDKPSTKYNGLYTIQEIEENIEKYNKLSKEFVVDKSTPENKLLRQNFKPVTFGVLYGLTAGNLSEKLNMPIEEAEVIIKTLEKTFPKAFTMVKAASKFALKNGYVVISERTNSKAYFPNIIKYLKKEVSWDTHGSDILKDANEARNIRIQGTQADFIKEASVRINKFLRKVTSDAYIVSWVHDEFIIDIDEKELYQNCKIGSKSFENVAEGCKYIACETANLYLPNNTKIDADYDIENYWIKG